MAAPCPDCGFDAAPLSPPDAVVAMRSFARRFAEIGQPDPDDDDAGVDAPTAETLGAAAAAAAAITTSGEQLRRVLVEDSPALGPAPDVDAAPTTAPADAIDRRPVRVQADAGWPAARSATPSAAVRSRSMASALSLIHI